MSQLEASLSIPKLDVRIYKNPEIGLTLPSNIDTELARKICKIYDEIYPSPEGLPTYDSHEFS
ncbi:MAG: hypothetical protein ACXVA2_08095 [Mucilaginibacter sp.]